MMRGPEKTNLSKFQGFGFGLNAGAKAGGPGPNRPGAPATPRRELPRGSAARPGAGAGVAILFQDALEEDGGAKRSAEAAGPSWAKPTAEAAQAQRQAEELLAADPTVFQYDEVIDAIKQDRDEGLGSQSIRTAALEQKKRVGLTVPKGADEAKAGTKRQSKYIEKVLVATDRRKVEQQTIEDRLLKKERTARKDCEVFVTEAFKEELKKRKKFVEELEEQEFRDGLKAAEKQEHGAGFADMYRNLLNSGLATSRGGEKVRERAAARTEEEDEAKEEPKEELKEDPEAKSATAEASDAATRERLDEAQSSFAVQDLAAGDAAGLELEPAGPAAGPAAGPTRRAAVASAAAEAAEQREQKATSAKERFLARKRAAAGSSDAAGPSAAGAGEPEP